MLNYHNNTSECVYGHEYKQLSPLMMFVKSSNGARPSLFCIYSIVISLNTKLTNEFVLSNLSTRELIKSSIDARKSEILPPSKKYTLTKFVLENIDINDTKGNWPFGRGNTPACAGQSIAEGKIRNMDTGDKTGLFICNRKELFFNGSSKQ